MNLEQNFLDIKSKIDQALLRSNRAKNSVTLVAVSKLQSTEKVKQFCEMQIALGNSVTLGENYVQEFRDKKDLLPPQILAHLIGPLQRNKAKLAVSLFNVIESVDSEKLIIEINKEAAKINKIQEIFLQVNISNDAAKSGFSPELLTEAFLKSLERYPSVSVKGLMTITKDYPQPELVRNDFKRLRELSIAIKPYLACPECFLSMGMSGDFEMAIEEGATHVRIGTALFGER